MPGERCCCCDRNSKGRWRRAASSSDLVCGVVPRRDAPSKHPSPSHTPATAPCRGAQRAPDGAQHEVEPRDTDLQERCRPRGLDRQNHLGPAGRQPTDTASDSACTWTCHDATQRNAGRGVQRPAAAACLLYGHARGLHLQGDRRRSGATPGKASRGSQRDAATNEPLTCHPPPRHRRRCRRRRCRRLRCWVRGPRARCCTAERAA